MENLTLRNYDSVYAHDLGIFEFVWVYQSEYAMVELLPKLVNSNAFRFGVDRSEHTVYAYSCDSELKQIR